MRRFPISLFIFLMIHGQLLSETPNGFIRTGFVVQMWSVETIKDAVSENTYPIEIMYPIRENLTVQLNHSPAVSRFGDINMSGLSDTWIRSTYAFQDRRALVSVGVGLPTGKTELNDTEASLSSFLCQNAFKFRLPVFGQGLTVSAGIMYAYPLNEKMTIGAGINYVLRGSYKYSKHQKDTYNPGDQIGANLGVDYLMLPKLRTNLDFVLSYYTADKMANEEMFVSGPKFSLKAGLQYQANFGYLWMRSYYSTKSKNETWNDQALVLEPDDKNYNITLREFEVGTKIGLLEMLSLLVSGELRSYVENEAKQGWADIFGLGLGYEFQPTERFAISMGAKFFFGDGNFLNIAPVPDLSGFELQMGTQYKFN